MGNYCGYCKESTETMVQEIQEQKRERVKLQTIFPEHDLIFLKSFSFKSPYSTHSDKIRLISKRYLTQKYLKTAKLLKNSQYKLLFSPLPTFFDSSCKPQHLHSYLYLKDRRLKVLPAIQLSPERFYEGQWNLYKLKPEGFGVLLEKTQGKYFGHMKDGKKHGKGHFVSTLGDIYDCEFINDTMDGSGTVTKKNGLTYKGQFKDGKEHGFGVLECEGEQVYEGQFEFGLKQGKGKLKISEGSLYVGEFFNDWMHGDGVYVWSDGKRYEGSWRRNVVHGEGKYSWPDGSEYCGGYKDGNRDGYGIFKWADGREYRGEWKMGVMNGSGIYRCRDKKEVFRTVKGVWEMGKRVS